MAAGGGNFDKTCFAFKFKMFSTVFTYLYTYLETVILQVKRFNSMSTDHLKFYQFVTIKCFNYDLKLLSC